MRVPFPIRVLLSYLLVLIVGALPTYIYLKVSFEQQLASHETRLLVKRTRRLAVHLSSLPASNKLPFLRAFAATMPERLTYIETNGAVLYDSSQIRMMDNHSQRPEVMIALGKRPARDAFSKLPGVGVSRRYSKSTRVETLYVAIAEAQQSGQATRLVRLAVPLSRVDRLESRLLSVFRNSLAAAISVALVLSLISAFVFMRPLQQMSAAAGRLAEGDYWVSFESLSNDEIGDVGRSLQQLAVELRRRLAMAEASETLLLQLVEIDQTPLAVFDQEGRIRALNGAARVLLESQKEDVKELLDRWIRSPGYQALWDNFERTGETQAVQLRLEEGREVEGVFHVIHHPSGASFGVFLGQQGKPQSHRSSLPLSSEVRSVTVGAVVGDALNRIASDLERSDVEVLRSTELEQLPVADVQGRLVLSLATALLGAAGRMSADSSIPLVFREEPLEVVVSIEARVPSLMLEGARLWLEPIGGAIEPTAAGCELRWPKA